MAERSEADRRKYHRIATDQVISFAEAGRDNKLAVSRDLSIGGIRFETVSCDIELGEVLRVTFNLGDHTIVAVGKVVWATDTDPLTIDVGLEFTEIDSRAEELLVEALESAEIFD